MGLFNAFLKKLSANSEQNIKKSNSPLNISEVTYQKLFDLSPNAIFISELNGKIQKANEEAAKLFGYLNPDEMVGKSSFNLIIPQDVERAKKQLDELLLKKHLSNLEYKALTKDGKKFLMTINAAVLYGQDGKPKGLVSIARDISQERMLQENKSFTASIVESADDAIIGKDLDGLITSWNKGAEKLYGYQEEETIGQSVSIFYPPELKDDLPKILARLKAGEFIHPFQTVRMDKFGNRIPV